MSLMCHLKRQAETRGSERGNARLIGLGLSSGNRRRPAKSCGGNAFARHSSSAKRTTRNHTLVAMEIDRQAKSTNL